MVTVLLGGMIAGLVKGIVDTLVELPVQMIVPPTFIVWSRSDLSLPV